MNLYRLLKQREADHKPLRVALLGAGKFGAMFMSQAPRTPGIRLVAVADLVPDRARAAISLIDSGSAKLVPAVAKAALALPPPVPLAPGAAIPGLTAPQQQDPNAQ